MVVGPESVVDAWVPAAVGADDVVGGGCEVGGEEDGGEEEEEVVDHFWMREAKVGRWTDIGRLGDWIGVRRGNGVLSAVNEECLNYSAFTLIVLTDFFPLWLMSDESDVDLFFYYTVIFSYSFFLGKDCQNDIILKKKKSNYYNSSR